MIYPGKPKPPRLRGFTLIELVVVIAIILLLLGLTLSAGLAIRKQSEVRETENILRLLDTAMQEWQRIAESPLSWGKDNLPPGTTYDLQGKVAALPLTPEILVITELLNVINRPDPVKNIIAQIDSDFIHRYVARQYPSWIPSPDETAMNEFDRGIVVLDAWGWPIYATHPGRVANPAAFQDDVDYPFVDKDGTVRTYNEGKYGTAINRTVVFVSAGPDGDFGDFSNPNNVDAIDKTKDNIYSTAIDR